MNAQTGPYTGDDFPVGTIVTIRVPRGSMTVEHDGTIVAVSGRGSYVFTTSSGQTATIHHSDVVRAVSPTDAIGVPYFRAVEGPDGLFCWLECPRCGLVVWNQDGYGPGDHWKANHA